MLIEEFVRMWSSVISYFCTKLENQTVKETYFVPRAITRKFLNTINSFDTDPKRF